MFILPKFLASAFAAVSLCLLAACGGLQTAPAVSDAPQISRAKPPLGILELKLAPRGPWSEAVAQPLVDNLSRDVVMRGLAHEVVETANQAPWRLEVILRDREAGGLRVASLLGNAPANEGLDARVLLIDRSDARVRDEFTVVTGSAWYLPWKGEDPAGQIAEVSRLIADGLAERVAAGTLAESE